MILRKVIIVLLTILISFHLSFSQTEQYNKARDYFMKGQNQFAVKQIDSAMTNFQEASSIFKEIESWKNYITCEYYIGQILIFNGNFEFAQRVYENIEKISNEKLDKENEIIASTYSSLGQIYFYKADVGLSLDYFDKALEIQRTLKGDSSIEVANIYNNMGNVFAQMGEYDFALDYYNQVIEIQLEVYDENNPAISTTYSNISNIYENRGEYDKSLEIRLKVLEIFKANYGENSVEVSDAYSGIGNIYINKTEYELAKEYVLKALEIKKNILGEGHHKVADEYISLGQIYEGTGENDKAEDYYFLALNIQIENLGENHPDIAGIYNNLGLIASNQGSYNTALQYYEYALEIKRANFGDFHPEIAIIYTNIGSIYYRKFEFEKAQENLERAISIGEAVFGEKHPNLVEPYLNIANIYYESNDDETALQYFQKSLIANLKTFDDYDYNVNPELENYYNINKILSSLHGKAKTFAGKYNNENNNDDLLKSFTTYQLCDTLIDKIRQTTTNKADKIAFGAVASELYADAISVCIKLNELFPEKSLYLKYAFYFSEKNKAGTLLEAISGAQAKKFAGIPDSLLETEKILNDQIAYYEKQLAELADIENEQFYRDQLFALNNQYRNLINDFEIQYPKYFEMKYSTNTASVDELQKYLDNETMLRSYFVTDEIIYIFSVTYNDINVEISPTFSDLNNQIQNFNTVITSGKSQNIIQYQQLAKKLYDLLFPNDIEKQITKIWIIPDGVLGTLPFESLFYEQYDGDIKDYKKYPFLIKKIMISYSYSANLFYTTILNNTSKGRPSKDWFGVAPVFEEQNTFEFNGYQIPKLEGSEIEVDTIMQDFINNNFIAEEIKHMEANESKFKSIDLKEYKFIHIATHGFVNPETPELSGLILSKSENSDEDGILYNGEIYNLNLNSDLFVMSACETGLGKISKGEGVIGLSRAILYAGAKNIIVSFWQVSDVSTTELMTNFYQNITKDNKNFDEIIDFSQYLHNAKIKMIEEGTYAHPYYWSAFVLIGK